MSLHGWGGATPGLKLRYVECKVPVEKQSYYSSYMFRQRKLKFQEPQRRVTLPLDATHKTNFTMTTTLARWRGCAPKRLMTACCEGALWQKHKTHLKLQKVQSDH